MQEKATLAAVPQLEVKGREKSYQPVLGLSTVEDDRLYTSDYRFVRKIGWLVILFDRLYSS